MKKLFTSVCVVVLGAVFNICSMDGNRPEGVVSRNHERDLVRAEQLRQFEEEREKFRQEREQRRQREMEYRQRVAEEDRRLAEEQTELSQTEKQRRIINRRLFDKG